jgi:hypothetical protein
MKTDSGRGYGFGRGECQPGDMFASSLENFTDKEDFYRALNLLKPERPPSFAQMMIPELPEINNVNRVQGNISKRPGSWSSWL